MTTRGEEGGWNCSNNCKNRGKNGSFLEQSGGTVLPSADEWVDKQWCRLPVCSFEGWCVEEALGYLVL